MAESQGILKVAPESGGILFEITDPGRVDNVAVDAGSGRVWTFSRLKHQRRLKAYNAEGVLEVDMAVPQIHKNAEPAGMVADREGVWVAAGHELFRFGEQGQLQKSIRFRRPINSLTLDTERSNLWVSVPGNIFILDSQGNDLDRWRTFFPFDMQLDYDRSLDACWLNLGPFLLRLNAENRELQFVSRFGAGFKFRRHVSADSQGGVWGTTSTHLNHMSASGQVDVNIKPFQNHRGPNRLQDLVADPEDGSVWIASRTTLKQYNLIGLPQKELTPDLGDDQKRIINGLALSVQSPPKLEIVSPKPGSFVNTAMPVIELRYHSRGEIDTGSIQIMWESLRVPLDCTSDQTEAHCTAILPPMVQGEITLTATVADTRGRVSEPAQVTFTIDTRPPAITVTHPSDGLITNQPQLTVSGNVSESPQTLTLDHDGELVSLQADSSNAFSHAITLTEGGNTLIITAIDAAGNLSSAVLNVTLDTVVPSAPDIGLITIGSPDFGQVSVTGQSGSVEPGSQVVITNLTTGESGTATAGGNGAFSSDIAAQAGDEIQIITTDAAGNSSGSVQGEVQEGGESEATQGELTLLAKPPFAYINEVENIEFSVIALKGVEDVIADVHLVQTDAEGNVLADIGEMADDGQNGDFQAGDWRYTFTLPIQETTPITRHYRAIVNLQNDDKQILSQVREFQVTEAPYSKEPDEDKLLYGLGYPFPANRAVVRLDKRETKMTAQILADSVNGTIVGYAPIVNQYSFEVPATTVEELDAIIEKLRADPRVAGVMRSLLIDFDVVNDMTKLREADADKARPFENIRAFQAWDMIDANLDSLMLSPVHVGIWDTGVNIDHLEFAGVTFGYLGLNHDVGGKTGCGSKVDSHGTGVAGIIGATSSLTVPGIEMNGILGGVVDSAGKPAIPYNLSVAKLVSAKSPEKFATEVNSMIKAGATVINFSAGMTLRSALRGSKASCLGADDADFDEYVNTWKDVVKSHEHDVVFVTSAGNDEIDVTKHAPAGSIHADNFIAVASTDAVDQRSDFSNYGQIIDIAAPGGGSSSSDRIYVPTKYTQPLSSNDYDGKRGTSFSAPFVSGAAALIKSLDKTLMPKQIKQLIRDTADPIETTPSIGGKRLNLQDLTKCGIDENFIWHFAGVGFGNDGAETDGSFATATKFRKPFGADHGPDGSLYVVDVVRYSDLSASRLRKIDRNGVVKLIAGIWQNGGFSGDGGPAINARFSGLSDVAVGRDGSIYLADQFNSRVRWIDPQGIVHTLAIGVGGDSNAGRYITGVAVSDDGAVYFTQQDPNAVYRVKGKSFTRIAGEDDAGVGIAYGLDVGPDGSVYLADSYNGRILKISPKGEFSTIAGSGELSVPYDVEVDHKGNLYVADNWDYNVKKITSNGEVSVIIPEFESPAGISFSRKDCGIVTVSEFGELLYRYD